MLAPWKKSYDKHRHILKSRDITLLTKVHLVKAMVFPVVMYRCESWTIEKDEHWRIDAFELWCWRRLLRVPWTASRSNQSVLKEISPECSLKRLMLKLKLQYFGHLMWRADSLEKILMLVEIDQRLSSKEQTSFNFMDAATFWSDFEAQENKVSHSFHCFPIYLPWSDGTGCHDLTLLNGEF